MQAKKTIAKQVSEKPAVTEQIEEKRVPAAKIREAIKPVGAPDNEEVTQTETKAVKE